MHAHTGYQGPLVDAVTGRQIRFVGPTNQLASLVPGARRFWGRTLDVALVLVLDVVALAVSGSWFPDANPGIFVFLTAHLVIVFVVGTISGTVGTLGERAGGFRSVHRRTGRRPGFWRGGLRGVLYSWTPALVFPLLGGELPTFESAFMQVDTRSGIARGIPPVPAP